MRTIGAIAIIAAAFAASAGSAQENALTVPGPNGMPMPNPGQDFENALRTVGSQVRPSGQPMARTEQRVADRREQARQQALVLVRSASGTPASSESIRRALEVDIRDWREEFAVGRDEWREMRETWLPSVDWYSAKEWAMRRLAWFAARDAWLADRQLAAR
jgi:hypothetical protein